MVRKARAGRLGYGTNLVRKAGVGSQGYGPNLKIIRFRLALGFDASDPEHETFILCLPLPVGIPSAKQNINYHMRLQYYKIKRFRLAPRAPSILKK